jgi:hypothetical protein
LPRGRGCGNLNPDRWRNAQHDCYSQLHPLTILNDLSGNAVLACGIGVRIDLVISRDRQSHERNESTEQFTDTGNLPARVIHSVQAEKTEYRFFFEAQQMINETATNDAE